VKGPALWDAIRNDQVTEWLTVNQLEMLGEEVR
jgi:hypothetical protein